ncbi:MAG: hypothetical protein EBZ36_07365 [Acidobacteria bacterium]|nr:hypothetical protein [Acidobacteriota bacterium]
MCASPTLWRLRRPRYCGRSPSSWSHGFTASGRRRRRCGSTVNTPTGRRWSAQSTSPGRRVVGPRPLAPTRLHRLFGRLNRHYFGGELTRPRLIWSPRRTRRILGRYDELLDTIVISRTLDDEEVPVFAVEFVLYHEMLHLRHPSRVVDGRRVYHSPAFRRDERRFARYDEAMEVLDLIK